jgi:hypothetical protein
MITEREENHYALSVDLVLNKTLHCADLKTLVLLERVSHRWRTSAREMIENSEWRSLQLRCRTWNAEWDDFSSYVSSYSPAGFNTTAFVSAVFDHACTVCFNVDETEITSDISDSEASSYDEYEEGAAWSAKYNGIIRSMQPSSSAAACQGESSAFEQSPSELDFPKDSWCFSVCIVAYERKGRFSLLPPSDVPCALGRDGSLHLALPFAAGGCNDGTAGVKVVVLKPASRD